MAEAGKTKDTAAIQQDLTAAPCSADARCLSLNFLNSGLQDQEPVPRLEGIPAVRNFRVSNVRVSEVPVLFEGTSIHPD